MHTENKIGWIFLGLIIIIAIVYGISSVKGNILQGNSITENVQEITMEVSYGGYSPNVFTLKKGVPVKWTINVKELTGCNSRIIVRDYNLDITLKKGKNIIEFTPTNIGTVSFSCSMGMLRGSFLVTEDGKATSDSLASAAPPVTSGSCGGGSGGCGGGCGGSCGGCGAK